MSLVKVAFNDYLEQIEIKLDSEKDFSHLDQDKKDFILDIIERYITRGIYKMRIGDKASLPEDLEIQQKLIELSKTNLYQLINIQNFEKEDQMLDLAAKELEKINEHKNTIEKLNAIGESKTLI